jgi:hypothetical protein
VCWESLPLPHSSKNVTKSTNMATTFESSTASTLHHRLLSSTNYNSLASLPKQTNDFSTTTPKENFNSSWLSEINSGRTNRNLRLNLANATPPGFLKLYGTEVLGPSKKRLLFDSLNAPPHRVWVLTPTMLALLRLQQSEAAQWDLSTTHYDLHIGRVSHCPTP